MRHIRRTGLTQPTLDRLAALTADVTGDPDPKARASQKWESKPDREFNEIRTTLERMASGRSRCMYCEDSAGTDIEHFWPKADYPARTFLWENYLLACSYCNSNLKRDEFPLDATGQPLLLDPTVDEPSEHLHFLPKDGTFIGLSTKGNETIRVFGLNASATPRELPRGRRAVYLTIIALLKEYDRVAVQDRDAADEIRATVRGQPFSSVFFWMIQVSRSRHAARILGTELVALLERHSIASWR